MGVPHFIGIGAQKAGTTWLYEMLSQNPGVWLPLKEIHYFDVDRDDEKTRATRMKRMMQKAKKVALRLKRGPKPGKPSPKPGRAELLTSLATEDVLTDAWYRRIFLQPDAEGKITGEITPAYLVLDEAEVVHVKDLIGDGKIIAIIREPVSRALSEIRMAISRSKKTPEKKGDWKRLIKRVVNNRRGAYAEAIPVWQRHFGPDQLLILPFGDIKTDPAGLIRRIEDFIGAPHHDGYKMLDESIHATKKAAIPDWVIAELETEVAPHREFIRATFGEDFARRTK